VGHGAKEAFPVLADTQDRPMCISLRNFNNGLHLHNVFEGEMSDHHGGKFKRKHGEWIIPVEHHAIMELLVQYFHHLKDQYEIM
jgi:hypothetical protein